MLLDYCQLPLKRGQDRRRWRPRPDHAHDLDQRQNRPRIRRLCGLPDFALWGHRPRCDRPVGHRRQSDRPQGLTRYDKTAAGRSDAGNSQIPRPRPGHFFLSKTAAPFGTIRAWP